MIFLKRIFLPILMVLLLSIGAISCDPPEEGGGDEDSSFPSDFPDTLIETLEDKGIPSFIGPENLEYSGSLVTGGNIFISWEDATEDHFNAYALAWESESARTVAMTDKYKVITDKFDALSYAVISFYETAGTDVDGLFPINANSIIFYGQVQ
ncbi:MAG: hypothetical protein FWB77_02795 [Treponema sp.]|nr:hypothetical protein [Treponema sp.]